MKKTKHTEMNSNRRLLWIVSIAIFVCFIVLRIIADAWGAQNVDYVDLSGQTSAEIIHPDGSKEYPESMAQWTVRRNDILRISLPLHEKPYRYTTLAFSTYNSVVTISCDGETLYSYGQKYWNRQRMIGHLQILLPLEDKYFGHTLTIELKDQEHLPASRGTSFCLLRTEEAGYYPLIHHEADFVVFLILMTGGLFGFLTAAVLWLTGSRNLNIISISLFSLFVGAWYFGYNCLFYVLIGSYRFCSVIEYYALDLASLPLLHFVLQSVHTKKEKTFVRVITVITWLYCGISLILSLSGAGINLTDTLPGLQMLLGIMFLSEIIILIMARHDQNESRQNEMLFIGLTFGMSFAIMQIAAIRLHGIRHLPGWLVWFLELDFAAIGLILLIATIILVTADRILVNFRKKTEQMELERLAFVDILSGIPNRSSCIEKLNAIHETDEYSIGFFDVDGLKHANDVYGHETGDVLIKTAAACIRESMEGIDGFYGRWGGDEFIACFQKAEDVPVFRSRFSRACEQASEKAQLPFAFSISEGYAFHAAGTSRTTTDMINAADASMYRSKQAKKAARI